MQKRRILTTKQLINSIQYVDELLSNLPDKALREIMSGYNNDTVYLFDQLVQQTYNIISGFKEEIDSESIGYLSNLEQAFDNQLKIVSYNYFKTTALTNFNQNWRNLEWGNMVQLYPYSAYLCQRGSGKCFAKGTRIVMFDGSIKCIEDIRVGDQVMGIDNTPRTILNLHSGVDQMYYVQQNQSLDYVVNSEHELCFHHHPLKKFVDSNGDSRWDIDWSTELTEITKLSAKDFFNKSESYKNRSYGIKVEGWELEEKDLEIDPYWLGLWLGDGNRLNTGIASIDTEVIDFIKDYANRLGLRYSRSKTKIEGISIEHSIVCSHGGDRNKKRNVLLDSLKKFNLIENKHIPEIYLRSSRRQRLELLAGLLDSDGYYDLDSNYSFSQTNRNLTEQVQLLCWSLGFRCNFTSHSNKYIRRDGLESVSFTTNISGKIWEIPCRIERKKSKRFKIKKKTTRCGIKVSKLNIDNYYGFTCDGDHLFILVDGTIVSNSYEFCYAFPLWRLFTYNRPSGFLTDTIDNRNRKETMIITNESSLGKNHVSKIVEEIRFNPLFDEKLNPTGKANLGKEGVETETGAMLKLRTYGSSGIRGNHLGACIVDDFLDKSALYSKEQRDKFREVFYAEITNIVEPGGFLLVSGTPFHELDLYGDLKKDAKFTVFEYPGIFPDGRILAPDRFSFDYLMELRESLGSIVFSREILVSPVSDKSSLFPYEFLSKASIGMENIDFVDNIESYPFKMKKVVIGCDFSISGGIGSDFVVYSVWGIDAMDNYHLLHIWRVKGVSHNEMISQLVSLDQRFKPNVIVPESNNFQRILANLAKERGLRNIKEFITGNNKKDLYSGLPSLSAMFERGQIKIPSKHGSTMDMTQLVFSEFNSVTFNEDSGKLESVSGHDDIPMSSWLAINELRENKNVFKGYYV